MQSILAVPPYPLPAVLKAKGSSTIPYDRSSTLITDLDIEKFGELPARTVTSQSSTDSCPANTPVAPCPLAASPSDFPDGGWKAWVTVAGAFVALFFTFGQLYTFGNYELWYSENQLKGMTSTTISWIGSIQLGTFFLAGAPVGRASDIVGPRPLLSLGTVVFVFSLMMTSISTKYYQFVICQGLLLGIGVALMFFPSVTAVSSWFQKYRATALGTVAAGTCLGGVVFTFAIRSMLPAIGFAWTVRVLGFASLAGCCVSIVTVENRLPPRGKSGPWVATKTFKDSRFTLLTIGSSFVALGLFIPLTYANPFTATLTTSVNEPFYVLAVMNGLGVLGRIAPAMLSDALGRFNCLFPCALISGLSCLVIWTVAQTLAPTMIFAAFYGFFAGAFVSLITPCIAQISELKEIGTNIGMLYTIISIPVFFGSPIGGAILERSGGSYIGLILFGGISLTLGSLFILASKLKIDSRLFARV